MKKYVIYPNGSSQVYEIPASKLVETLEGLGFSKGVVRGPVK